MAVHVGISVKAAERNISFRNAKAHTAAQSLDANG